MYQSRRDGRFLSVNPAFVEMFGFAKADERLRAADRRARSTGTRSIALEFARRVESEGEIRNFEFIARHRSGKQLVLLENARAIRDSAGRFVGYEGTLNDITERKNAQSRRCSRRRSAPKSRCSPLAMP